VPVARKDLTYRLVAPFGDSMDYGSLKFGMIGIEPGLPIVNELTIPSGDISATSLVRQRIGNSALTYR
jgi:hypothetical protein